MRVDNRSLKATLFNLRKMEVTEMRKIERAAVDAMGRVAEEAVRANVSRRDYSLEDLRKLDHPYATRHADIKVHGGSRSIVHMQTGRLEKSLGRHIKTTRGGKGGSHHVVRVGFINNPPEYAKAVLWGTQKMHGRQTLVFTILNVEVKKKMMRAILQTIGPKLRGQMGVRFSGTN